MRNVLTPSLVPNEVQSVIGLLTMVTASLRVTEELI